MTNSCGAANTDIQAIKVKPPTPTIRRTMICPSAQVIEPATTSMSAVEAPARRGSPTITATPAKAIAMPSHFRAPGFSLSSTTPRSTRKGTSSWITRTAVEASVPARPLKVRLYWIAPETSASAKICPM